MKLLICIFLTLAAAIIGGILLMPRLAESPHGRSLQDTIAGRKILVVYYSRTGMNYVSGDIVNLPVGNTAAVADIIREKTGADVFEIKTVTPYPDDYRQTTDVAKQEMRSNARPEIVGEVENIDQYDTIILGYPNWWGTMPMAVFTFLEKHQLAGKTILPYCTHEGSGMGRSIRDLKRLLPDSTLKKGLPIKGTRVYRQDRDIPLEVQEWLIHNL